MDHEQASIDADYELSERLGAEILLLGAAAPESPRPVARYETRVVRTVNLVTGESSHSLATVKL